MRRCLLRAHQDTYGNGAGVNLGLLTPATHFLPTMPTSLVQKLRDIIAGNDHSPIGDLDGVQSISTHEIALVGVCELVDDLFGMIAALGGTDFDLHVLTPFEMN